MVRHFHQGRIVEDHVGRQALINSKLFAQGFEFFQQFRVVDLFEDFTLLPRRFFDPVVLAQENLCLALAITVCSAR